MTVALFLQGLARPIGKHRQAQIQNRLIQKRDHREHGQLDILGRIGPAARVFIGLLDPAQIWARKEAASATCWRLDRKRSPTVSSS